MRASGYVVEDLARSILARHAIVDAPVDVDAVARAEGLTFEHAPTFLVRGAYFVGPDARGRAFIREADPPLVQRFTKAHELGHHVLDTVLELPESYRLADRHPLHERFAGALLMPREWVAEVTHRAEGRGRVGAVARMFQVTWPAALVRLRELGL